MKYLYIILLLFIPAQINAQNIKNKGIITGVVLDADNKKGMDFCTVTLINSKDSSIVTGVLTNENGIYKIDNVTNGKYIIKVSFVGHIPSFKNDIEVSEKNVEINLSPIFLKLKQLKTVEIVAEKNTLQLEPDKKVFNVDKSIITQGGTAADVLKNVPTINVDADGNMNLRGSDNITIYIDGRQSAQMSSNPTQALQQLPAGMIEKIEIITNPDSRFEASGSTGIINIVTKKNSQQGFNGGITSGFGSNDKFNTINKFNNSITLNYQQKKVNLFTSYSQRYDTRTGFGIMDLDNFINSNIPKLSQNSNSLNLNRTHNIKLGFDYNISKSLVTGISASRNFGYQNNDENVVFYTQNAKSDTIAKNKRISGTLNDSKNFDAAYFLKKTFKKPLHTIGIDASYSENKNNQFTDYSDYGYNLVEKYYLNNPLIVKVTQPTNNKTYNIQSDYSNSIKKIKLEAGIRYTNRIIDNIFNLDTLNTNQSKTFENYFTYNEKVAASYVSASSEVSEFKLKAGLRGENTNYLFEQKSLGVNFSNIYFSLFPTASIGKKLKNEIDFSLSYSKRINRPATGNLNPLPDITNPNNIMVGNPNLKPVFIHAFEANFSKYFGQQFVLTTFYLRRQINNVQRYKTIDSAGIGTVTFRNLNNSTNYGIEIVTKNQLSNKIDITSNLNIFEQQLNGNNIVEGLNNRNFAATIRLILNAKLPKEINFQLSANYNSPTRSLIGNIKALGFAEIGLRRDFLKRKLSASLSLNDIFDTQIFRLKIGTSDFSQNMKRKRETRIIQFSLNYRFGQADGKKARQQQENQEKQGGGNMDVF